MAAVRYDHAQVLIRGRIYVFGGTASKTDSEVFDVPENFWKGVQALPYKCS
jgi:hypothetical protein